LIIRLDALVKPVILLDVGDDCAVVVAEGEVALDPPIIIVVLLPATVTFVAGPPVVPLEGGP